MEDVICVISYVLKADHTRDCFDDIRIALAINGKLFLLGPAV
jgi:hypothetical protein